jgi:hypothetical protein
VKGEPPAEPPAQGEPDPGHGERPDVAGHGERTGVDGSKPRSRASVIAAALAIVAVRSSQAVAPAIAARWQHRAGSGRSESAASPKLTIGRTVATGAGASAMPALERPTECTEIRIAEHERDGRQIVVGTLDLAHRCGLPHGQ